MTRRSSRPPSGSFAGIRLEPTDDPDRIVLSWPIDGTVDPRALTEAELEILVGILRGDSDEGIAERRGTSARTVAVQARSIYAKLGVSGRRALLALLG